VLDQELILLILAFKSPPMAILYYN